MVNDKLFHVFVIYSNYTNIANQYAEVLNAAFPPVIIKSVEFMAISIPTIEINDIEKAVFKARGQLNFSRVLRIIVSSTTEVIKLYPVVYACFLLFF